MPAASIPVVGFNAVLMSEHFGAFFAFVVLHLAMLVRFVHTLLPPKAFKAAVALVASVGASALAAVAAWVVRYVMAHPTYGWTGEWLVAVGAVGVRGGLGGLTRW